MKAHISRHAVLLCAGFDDSLLKQVNDICARGSVTVNVVPKAKYGHTVGWLCGEPGAEKARQDIEGELPSQPVMVLHGFDEAQVNLLLDTLADRKLDIPLKALTTKTSLGWPFYKLMQQLALEGKAMADAVK